MITSEKAKDINDTIIGTLLILLNMFGCLSLDYPFRCINFYTFVELSVGVDNRSLFVNTLLGFDLVSFEWHNCDILGRR